MPEPRFVIVGTGRSGSTYISQILTKSGIPCGGESWWRPQGVRQEGLIGDSSCCALPQGLDGYSGLVFHQVRHPLDVIQSYVRAPVREPHLSIFHKLIPDVDPSDVLGFAMNFWVATVETAELYTNGGWWRLGEVDHDLVVKIGRLVGVDVDPRLVQRAFRVTPVVQHYSDRSNPLDWGDLERHDVKLAHHIREVAHRYGF